jgi:muramidase (phage lysozyme)
MLATELNRGMTSKQTDIQPTVSADSSRDRFELQGEMRDLPVLDDEDTPSVDTLSNEALDKELPSAGLGSRPVAEALTDDDMGITSKPIPTYIVPKTKAEIKDTQKSLSDAGYYSEKLAKIDGLKGANYENSIKSFQYNNNLKVTGEIDEPTSILLREGESSFVTNPKPSDPLLSFISSGEGGYGAANNGTSSRLKKKGKLFSVYDSYYSDENNKPLQNMTVREILNSQTGNTGFSLQQIKDYMKGNTNKKGKYTAPSRELDNREFFAVGAYQIIPTTMMAAVNSMGLTGEETFTPQLQDKIAKDFLSSKKRPFLNNYLIGTDSVSLEQAMDDIAKEWASLPTSSGGSHYSGQRSAHTIEEAKEILKNSKSKYEAENLGLGV